MCGCFVVLLGSAFPRLALIITWIFTNRVDIAFKGDFWLPVLGLLFLPTPRSSMSSPTHRSPRCRARVVFVAFGFLLDLASWFGGGVEGRRRYA